MAKKERTEFSVRVIEWVKRIPHGKVATYKQIAELAGRPHASRGVAWILNSCSKKYGLKWYRVLNSKQKISFRPGSHNYAMQKSLLKREGVRFLDSDEIDFAKYRWKKMARRKRSKRPMPRLFS